MDYKNKEMKNSTQKIFLQLLRAAMGLRAAEERIGELTSSEWATVIRLCAQQGVGPLVFPWVLAQKDEDVKELRDERLRMQMKQVCMQTMQQHVQLQHTLRAAWEAMEKAGIRAVLMKGAGLAAFYPEPQMRHWGDIDLFVGKEQYHAAAAVMRETFPKALKFDEELDHYKHYNLIADGISIEVHRVSMSIQHPIDARRYEQMETEGMGKADTLESSDGLSIRVPEATFNALMVMMHSWEHFTTSGASVRQVCDLTFLLHHYAGQIDMPRLQRYLKALKLTDVWQLYMWIAVEGMGLPEAEAPFYTPSCGERAERLLMQMIRTGSAVAERKTSPAPKNRLARKWHTMRGRIAEARALRAYSPAYARHAIAGVMAKGATRLFAKDRHWE